MRNIRCLPGLVSFVLIVGLVASLAEAVPITFSASSGSRSASASFDVIGGDLQVILTNTATADATVPTDILTAVFFTIPGDPALTRISAVVGPGSTVLFGGTDPGGVVGGEWAYLSGISGPLGANQGISSAGFGIFRPDHLFPGSDLQGPPSGSPDGIQYGITSAGDNPATPPPPTDTGGLVSQALIQNSVVFTLGGLPASFDLNGISGVSFQYGTSLTVPEPATLLLLGSGLVGVGLWRRKSISGF